MFTPGRPDSPRSNIDILGIAPFETVTEILARLPPISEVEEEEEEESPPPATPPTIEAIHNQDIDDWTGNSDMDGRFREWHEPYLSRGYQDAPIVILPYVLTEF